MKFISIFVSDSSEDGVWSMRFKDESQDEFDRFFDRVNDPEWVRNFFARNKTDLLTGFFGNITIQEAVLRTLKEAEELEDMLYDYAEQGFEGSDNNLQYLFKPLNNFEHVIAVHQKSKARIRNGWLRLYAIRITENCYLITGGAVKLTQSMRRAHLQKELIKLERVKEFLQDNGINYPEDLNIYPDE
jgi:hypothetical protein